MKNTVSKHFSFIKKVSDISEFQHKNNGLRVLYKFIPNTDVVTTNLTYLVGARDEKIGESGIAHMLEHMLFKPTSFDLKRKTDARSMKFEREVGVILNANTWKDRTTYYFSYDKCQFSRALQVEAERMRDLVLSDKEFLPERTNVLSEFDMYNGDPNFALSVGICSTAFLCHPYGHETIGFREDIENYTTTKLKEFYDTYYCPNNAVLMVIGDIDENKALEEVNKYFGHIPKNTKLPIRSEIREPKQEGVRRIDINRPGTTHVLAIGVKHGGFPSSDWYETALALELLAQGEDSILHKKLVDTGLATSVSVSQEPTKDTNVAIISVVLTKKTTHEKMETLFKKIISEVDESYIKKVLPTLVTKNLTDEVFNRDSSLSIASELTEFVAAGDWSAFFNTENSLKKINSKQVLKKITELFTENNLTIGYYKSF